MIPGLSQSRVVGKRVLLDNEELKSQVIHMTTLEPTREVVTEVSFYAAIDGSTLLVTPVRLAVRSILRFDVSDHVFCYGVRAVGAFYDTKSKRGGYGGEYTLLYYDDDGMDYSNACKTSANPFQRLAPSYLIGRFVRNNPRRKGNGKEKG